MRRGAGLALVPLVFSLAACEPGPSDESEQALALSAIGYVAGTDPIGPRTGITRHDPARVAAGLNLLTSGHAPVAILMDMKGAIRHQWSAGFRDLFPAHPSAGEGAAPERNFWRVARLLPEGELIVIWELYGIFKLDRNSRILWVVPSRAHHDLQVTENGAIVHLAARRTRIQGIEEEPATEDFIVTRDASGVETSRLAISQALRNADWPKLRDAFWERARSRGYDLGDRARRDPFHTNSLQILSEGQAHRLGDAFEPGDALVSMAMLDTIAVLDLARGRARWWQQGPFGMQHHPRVTPDGGLIVFDNFRAPQRSAVRIMDPRTRRTTWEYPSSESEALFSLRSSSADVLAGGNVLIVETDRGRALEVTQGGEVVWEFRSPFRTGEQRDRVAHLYSLERVPHSSVPWLTR